MKGRVMLGGGGAMRAGCREMSASCNHTWTLMAGLGGTVKVCTACGYVVKVTVLIPINRETRH